MSDQRTITRDAAPAAPSLTSLLGEGRAAIVEHLRRQREATVAELAELLGISEVAVRRHLGVLTEDGLVEARTVPQGRGRPPSRYHLTDAATQLFPQRYDRFAGEVLDFLADELGRDGLRAFLRWRLERQVETLRDAVTAEDLHERLEQLADALSASGFDASVSDNGRAFTLTQEHCAIYDVAKHHPEVCAYEAAAFSRALGGDVSLSRRETLADGSSACVCTITPKDAGRAAPSETNHTDGADPNRSDDPSTSRSGPGDEL